MRTKNVAILIIIALVAFGAVAGSYFLFFSQPQYKNITLNNVTMEVPESSVNVTQRSSLYSMYNDTKNSHVDAFVFDSANAGINDMTEAMEFAMVRDGFQINSTQQTADGITYNYSKSLGVYSYVTNFTHKNVLIVTGDKENMVHIVKSLKVKQNETNTTNTTASTKTSSSSKKTYTKTSTNKQSSNTLYIDGDPEVNGKYKGVGEGIYRDTKTGKVYSQTGKNTYKRSPELDNYEGLAE